MAKSFLNSSHIIFDFSESLFIAAPTFQGQRIKCPLRHFVKEISYAEGFLEFFNLNRNAKYKSMDIDWLNTFNYLSHDSKSHLTSFKSSSLKARRIKLLLEELPTLEYLNKWKPQLYPEDWKCYKCGETETFAHLWNCPQLYDTMIDIIDNTACLLTTILEKFDDTFNNEHPIIQQMFNIPHLWTVQHSYDIFSFEDMIKGFMPTSLSCKIRSLVDTNSTTTTITNTLLQFIFDQVQEKLWLSCCNAVIAKEHSLNITQAQKTAASNSSSSFLKRSAYVLSHVATKPIFNSYLASIDDLLRASIRNGERFALFGRVMTSHLSSLVNNFLFIRISWNS